ncbi:MAG: hypothetical protein JWO56_3320 [Acidobacteria bacterium]|nr:hypothetical protein [Acidobacteriota bacterium]
MVYGKDQPEYEPLPSLRISMEGTLGILTRWRLSWRERLRVLRTGDVYLQVLTGGQALQPVLVGAEPPQIVAGEEPRS